MPAWHTGQYEFEDLISQWEDASLFVWAPAPHEGLSKATRRTVNGTRRRAGRARRTPPWVFPSVRPESVSTYHDLFFMVAHHPYQLAYLHRLDGWREHSANAVCLLVEAWSPDLTANADYLAVLREFDQVFVFNAETARALRANGVAHADYLPMAVDTELFSPFPRPPERIIDVYSLGRREKSIHDNLVRAMRDDGLTYVYDTLDSNRVAAPADHRVLIANLIKRSQFFVTHRINDSAERRAVTGGDEALSTRYFEGAAGGAALIGSATPSEEFRACFGWADSVFDLPIDAPDAAGMIAELRAQPRRLDRARRRNAVESLRRHDWGHRWLATLESVGMAAPAPLTERLARLQAMSDDAARE